MDAHPDSTSSSSSSQLTFGVDRILSGAFPSVRRPPLHHSAFGPCAECVTSLLRCCRLSDAQVQVQVHSPRPLRPYANLLLGAEGAVASPNVATSAPGSGGSGSGAKRKRSWSRAVFSNLQRKGLEKRFQLQKYITKPDRRQLAATLGLTDAQVKVWFQNRRMKWRHSKEGKQQQQQPIGGQDCGVGDVADSTQEDPLLDVQALDS